MSKINITIDNFEGPLQLLLELIEVNEMDITDISISHITDQYIEYLSEMEEMDLTVAADFLIMATVLLDLKLKMLFPKHTVRKDWSGEITEDPRQSLVERLLEYKLYKDTAETLREREMEEAKSYSKIKEDSEYELLKKSTTLINFDLSMLMGLYSDLMKDYEDQKNYLDPYTMAPPKLSIRHCKELILSNLAMSGGYMDFKRVIYHRTKVEILLIFLSLLDLYKQSHIDLKQDEQFGSLFIEAMVKEGE